MSAYPRYALEEQLIMEVESHRILYDKTDPNHKFKGRMDDAWKEINFVLEEDGTNYSWN